MRKLLFFPLIFLTLFGSAQKQSYQSPDQGVVFREVFNSAQEVAVNGGVATAVTFADGKGVFNGASSKVVYAKYVGGVKSVRVRLTLTGTSHGVMTLTASHRITITTGTVAATGFATPTIYVDGVATSTITAGTHEIAVTTATPINTNLLAVGWNGTAYLTGSVDLVEIYNRQLSASEVSNLYNGVTYKPLIPATSLDLTTINGVVQERTGKTITQSNITYVQNGSYKSAKYNGTTSYMTTTGGGLTGAVCIMGIFRANGWGESGMGRIFDNTGITIFISNIAADEGLCFQRDNASTVQSYSKSIILGKTYFYAITSTSTGVTNFYICDIKSPPVLSGSANQAAGTPVSGTTWYIGNRAANDRAFNGFIPSIVILPFIPTLNQITQQWSATRKFLN